MSEQPLLTGSFIWTLEDVKTRQDILLGIRQRRFLFISLILVVAVVALYWKSVNGVVFRSAGDLILFVLPVLVILITCFFLRSNQNINLKKAFLQSPDCNKRIDVLFTREDITMKAEGIYENKWKWNTILLVQRSPKGFCFFLAERTGFWVPIRAFASQADADAMTDLARQLEREIPSLTYREVT
jgi:hypothetical protein